MAVHVPDLFFDNVLLEAIVTTYHQVRMLVPSTSCKMSLFLGGYYTIEQSHSKLRIVVLNSVLWAGGAARTDGPHRGRAQWEWLEQVLSKARRKNEMVSH